MTGVGSRGTGNRSQETGDREHEATGLIARLLSPVSCLLLVLCLALPILAHGCHGDDVDHEPSATHREPEVSR